MKITKLHIENFRSIRSLDLELEDTTVFIGQNNAGKSAILEALRIALSRRWGQQGTGFTENDVHCPDDKTDPRTAPPVKIGLTFDEPAVGAWSEDMVADLDDIMAMMPDGLNRVAFAVSYSWNTETKAFEPEWKFFDSAGMPLPSRRRSINLLSNLFNYLPFFWLDALRDADIEFGARSRHWGSLLRSIEIPPELEEEVKASLDALDQKILGADPTLTRISETIGKSTEIAVGEGPGGAKLRMLPLNMWDLLSRAGVVMRNEDARPWLPLTHHGQGLQSLAIIFLFQAAAHQKLLEQEEGAEPVFAVEEPEVHLHPQAARTLWKRVSEIPGQKLVTTHSPYFVQQVPLHNLRIVRSSNGRAEVASLPRRIISDLPWTTEADKFITGKRLQQFEKDSASGHISATSWFTAKSATELAECWRTDKDATAFRDKVAAFHNACSILISTEEERDLAFLGRRVRGEIFFAATWVLVEGPSEFLLLHAIGQALDYDLDQHGVAVIDFQNNGNAVIYPALASAFGISWKMVTDGDPQGLEFQSQLRTRGFSEDDIKTYVSNLTPQNDLEDQLLADGHEKLLRGILVDMGIKRAGACSEQDLKQIMKNRKTAYMTRLAPAVSVDAKLARMMPKPLVDLIDKLKETRE